MISISLDQSLLIAILAGLAGIDNLNIFTHFHRPIVMGPIIGLILGDPMKGLLAGATFELIWMGAVPIGGAQPPNVVLGGIMGTVFAILLNQSPATSIAVAIPFAILAQACITLLFTVYSPVMHWADQLAQKNKMTTLNMLALLQLAILFIFYFCLTFFPIYFGATAAKQAIDHIPQWILGGLSVAGGMMPAMGFAILLGVMLKRGFFIFVLLGFLLVAYLKLSILPVALFAVFVGFYDLLHVQAKPSPTEPNNHKNDQGDHNESNGI